MEREIKFRAWNTETQDWEEDSFDADSEDSGDIPTYYIVNTFAKNMEDSVYVFQQYTDLTDKNGKEIYEGDICTILGTEPVVIEFKDGGFGWSSGLVKDDFIGFAGHNHRSDVMATIEVIGNIFENPELMSNGK